MTFATLRALHGIIGEALDDMERVYHLHRPDTVASDVEEAYGDYDFEPTTTRGSPHIPCAGFNNDYRPSCRAGHRSTLSAGSSNAISKAYVSPPPSPCVATHEMGCRIAAASEPLLDFPSLDAPCDPSSPAEMLTSDPKVMAAINRIIAACGQMSATVQTPFLTICDSTMGYHLPSCMRIVEAAHVAEILRDSGSCGLHVEDLSERCGVESSKLAHVLRLLATHHIFREIAPNVFAMNRISSLIDSGKSLYQLSEYRTSGRPELKYQGTNGIAAFVGLCSDEINKASAYMTEAYLLSSSSKVRRANEPSLAPFCFAFGTAHLGVDYFGWLEGEGFHHDDGRRESHDTSGAQTGNGVGPLPASYESSDAPDIRSQHTRTQSTSTDLKAGNPNRFRLERFGKAMSGTGSWEAPGAVFNAFEWRSLPRGSVIVDVGGGIGSTSMLLASAFSSVEGQDLGLKFIIQDRSVVVEMGEKAWREKCPELLDSGLATFQVHDFFTPQPVKNASVFLLRVVLHDWPDNYARKILLHLRHAATPHTRLLLADFILPLACAETMSSDSGLEGIEGAQNVLAPAPLLPNLGKASANVYWMDLTMNAMFNSQERTLREIVALTRSAGWKVVRVTQAPGSHFGHIIAVPASIPAPRQRSRSRRESISARLSSIGASSIENTKKRLGLWAKENEDPSDIGVSRSASLRCNTPTFGSRTELSSFKEALARFGGNVKRRSVGMRRGSTSAPGYHPGIPKSEVPSERSTKKRPSPLSVPPATSSGIEITPSSSSSTTKPEGGSGFRKTIRRHVSLASLSRKASDQEPPPAVPPLPQQLLTPVSPTYPLPSRLPRHSSFTHLRQTSTSSSNLSPPSSFLPLRPSAESAPQPTTFPGHRHSKSTSSSSIPVRARCYSTIQLGQPHPPVASSAGLSSSYRKSRTGGILRLERTNTRMEDTRSFSPEIPASGGKMNSVLSLLNLRRSSHQT